ncbi:hypothetical protein [Schaalia odontolytica]|uniref:hypothetical protein n=1 Tax=Schaalia odontolytica TaxID=1660 RepID=UPI00211B76C6|nr:hypothetical protein [Schaalia odontolytica]UUO93292.1 hypothetical protein NQK35_09020 [Schaalia odontolytica]
MSAHNDERRETGADEQEHGRPEKPKRSRRWALLVLALPIALLAWSCVPKRPLPVTPTSELAIGDAVIAVQLGEAQSQSGLSAPIQNNLVALVDAQGKQDIIRIDNQSEGRILWADRGISFGSEQWEYQTTENGTSSQETEDWRGSDVQRYELSDGRIIVVSYEIDLAYRVDTIGLDGSVTSVSTPGTRGDIGQCGDRILSIVDTKQLWRMKSEAFEAYAAQSGGDGEQPEELSVVIQLNDRDGDTPRILGVAPMIEGLVSGQREFACEGDVITIPSVQTGDSQATRVLADGREEGTMVLERWDLSTGQRTIVPVIDEQENPIEVNRERSIFRYKGVQVGDEYRFISEGGDAFSVDLTSGRGRYLFTYQGTRINQRMVFQVSETGVYALEGRREDHNVTLSYRPWDGGAYRDVITMNRLADYVWLEGDFMSAGYWREIESFALRPGWDGGAQ